MLPKWLSSVFRFCECTVFLAIWACVAEVLFPKSVNAVKLPSSLIWSLNLSFVLWILQKCISSAQTRVWKARDEGRESSLIVIMCLAVWTNEPQIQTIWLISITYSRPKGFVQLQNVLKKIYLLPKPSDWRKKSCDTHLILWMVCEYCDHWSKVCIWEWEWHCFFILFFISQWLYKCAQQE